MAKHSTRRCISLFGALFLLLGLLLPMPAAAAELYGLVIGINDYIGTDNDLEGAVNDAGDIARALDAAGAKEVVRLLDADASKDHIASAWQALVAKAKAGDTIVFSYASHGG
jgi:Caspase domain